MRKMLAALATGLCLPALDLSPLGLPALSLPALAAETDITLPDVVVTATRVPTAVEKIPASVTIIDRNKIESFGYNTLAEALAEVPGVRVSAAGGPGGQTSVFIRGTNSNHVLVLRDGMPINDPAEATGAYNLGVDTLSDIDRIEVIRGPMAALYGSGAIGGVINLISRKGAKEGPRFQFDLAAGLPAQVRGTAVASGIEGPFDYALTLASQSQRGYDAVPERMSIYTGTPQGFRDRIGTVNLGYSPVEGTRLSLFFRARRALFGFNNLGAPTWDTANSSSTADSLLGRVGATTTLFDGIYETGLFAGRLQDNRHYRQLLDPLDPNQASSDSRYTAWRTDIQWNNTVHLDTLVPSGALSETALTFGYQHTADSIKVNSSSVTAGFPFAQAVNASMVTNAMNVGLQSTLWERLTVTGQMRQDWVVDNAPTTWRLGGVVAVPEIGTRFKASYGTSFRMPSLYDLYGVDSFGYVGNPALKPERAQGWEAGFTTSLDAFDRRNLVTFGATYFNQQVQNLIVTVFSPVYTATNIGSAHVQGVETEFAVRPADWLTLQATYTYTDTTGIGQSPAIGSRLLRRPAHAASFDTILTPLPGLKVIPQLVYTSAFRDFTYDDAGFPASYGWSGHGLIASLSASYDLTPQVQLYLTVRNMFASRFETVNGYQTPGPSGWVGVRIGL
ncbi:MAG: TonB-dependent receptor plug domain-containing protein [Acetobacteraceae bacterium]